MVLTPVMSRVRAAAAVSSGAAMVCLACGGFTAVPATQPASTGPAASVRLVAQVSPLAARLPGAVTASGLGGGPGGGSGDSDGSAGDAVAPSPAKHASSGGSSSSSSGGSTGHHVASAEGPGLVAGIFKKVGKWLGVSSHDSQTTGEPAAEAPKHPKPSSGATGGSGDAGGGAGGGKPADASGVSDILHSVFAGLGRFFSGLFGG